MDIEEILDAAELPTTSVTLCLTGGLVAEYERLEVEFADASPMATSLADTSPKSAVAARMAELRERMLAHETTFTLRAMPAREGSDFRATTPERKDDQAQTQQDFDDLWEAWACQLVARCCTDPAMTAEQAAQLAQKLSAAQWLRLVNAAWTVNYNKQAVPFSAAAFALTLASGAKSKRPEQPEPADHGSLAGPSPNEPSTTTTTPDG
jgi:hypothetical protein